MSEKTYNGWTNYATWRVNLEIFDNMNVREYFDALPELYDLAAWAREYAEQLVEDSGSGLAQDYALAFLSDVDWRSIAEHLLDAAQEEAA